MTIIDSKNPRFVTSVPTADGRFMIASMIGGCTTIMSTFVGTLDEVEIICRTWNEREMGRYAADSQSQMVQALTNELPSIDEIAAEHGIKI
ncbi:hypothetical protein [Bradyrhizobium zhanjiangense]|uniref:DUF1488 family protein n=1 Tax=Bradyrhizobium zhanjiangense TaxID=1325107 RepID=A0ABY0D9I4_9BRAD|nr:hypothetical protein [Bradyrhizobium zhanjiangense]RXG86491.1 hypothetical protein EAS62_37240 [Bradyrhizobium zhanjiangense]